MGEQREGYRPPAAETQVEEQKGGVVVEVSEAKEAKMPSIEDLDVLLLP